ncbi:MAG: Fur family transcriptional regulator [Candidatus Brocadiia bacterium]
MSINNDTCAPPRQLDADLQSALWTLGGYLRRRGLRDTVQRRAVLREALQADEHFDAEQLYDCLRERGEKVSLATVYRTLSLLAEAGLIREVLQGNGDRAHYEAIYGHAHHDHMVCVECGRVIEFCAERIEQLQRRICRRHGFQPLDHRMSIRGICRECRQKRARREQDV